MRDAYAAVHSATLANSFVQYFGAQSAEHNDAEKEMRNQILKDLPRTSPSVHMFQQKHIQDSLERILFVWSVRHPASGYVQGINDLVTPFFTVFLADEGSNATLHNSEQTQRMTVRR